MRKGSAALKAYNLYNVLPYWQLVNTEVFCHYMALTFFSLVTLQLYELNDDPKRKEFLDDLFNFMQKRGKFSSKFQ